MTDPVAPSRRPDNRGARVTALTVGMASVAVALTAAVAGLGPVDSDQVRLGLLVLAVLFAVTEMMVVHIEARGGTYTLSFGEAPLVVGLALAGPLALVVGRVGGSTLSLALHRRQPVRKLAFNVAMIGLETTVAVVVYRAVLGTDGVLSLRGALAALVATLAADTFSSLAVTTVIWVSSGERPNSGVIAQLLRVSWATGLANAGLGLGVVAALLHNPLVLLPLAAVMLVLYLLYRAYVRLNQRFTSLVTLHDFAQEVGGSLDLPVVAATMLGAARRLLRAGRADLVLLGEGGADATWVSDRNDAVDVRRLPESCIRVEFGALLADESARIVDAAVLPPVLGMAARRTVVSPVKSERGVIGMAFATDRESEVTPFEPEDVTLFETLTSNASVSLQKSALFGQLQEEAADRLHRALHDPLTGLPNRQALEQELQVALTEARVAGRRVAVVLIDLDGFKEINDTLGHQAGDDVLRALSGRLAVAAPAGGFVTRFGGDEFVMVLRDVDDIDQAVAATALLADALAAPVRRGELGLAVGARMGIAVFPDHGTDAMTLLQRADVAMYDARGSLSVCAVYSADRDPFTPQRLELMGQLREAMGRGEIETWFQPQLDLRRGLVVGAEALVRWRHPFRGVIEPGDFVALSDRTGLARPLAVHVLAAALAACATWRAAGMNLAVSVNLSVRNLLDPDFPAAVFDLLASSGVPAGALTMEVTESSIMAESRRALTALSELQALGVGLSLDDFGTGYSSLTRLREVPVAELKIDRSFVARATIDPDDAAIVSSTIDLAHRLGLRVVAEGVENADTIAWLAEQGCDLVQGFYLSRPLPPPIFADWLARHPVGSRPAPSRSLDSRSP